jgi:glycosyltransferase involved in cell wall biosynthesis
MPDALAPVASKRRLLCLTRYYTHKNLESLLELYRRHRAQLTDTVIVTTLDPASAGASGFLRQIEELGLDDCFVNLGEVPQRELAACFHHVDGLILPTVLESYSGTYCESFAFGVPVLTSDRDFARTICGSAAEYFDPLDVDTIFHAIRRVLDDADHARALKQAGYAQLESIATPWSEIARQLLVDLDTFHASLRKTP